MISTYAKEKKIHGKNKCPKILPDFERKRKIQIVRCFNDKF
jgi:hypothetical protein